MRLWLTRISWAYLASVSVYGLLIWGLGDRWWPATILLYLGRWVLLLPAIALVPATIAVRRMLLLPIALAACVAAIPVAGFRIPVLALIPRPAGTHIRLVTFNVDGGAFLADHLPVLLEEWKADIVTMQECGEDLSAAAAKLADWHVHTVRQLCFLSRFPIAATAVMDRSVLERVNESETAGIGGSGDVARYTVQLPSGPVSITNLHLETPRKGLESILDGAFNLERLKGNTELRAIESRLARRWVDAGTAPTLVAGDFNTPVESTIFQDSWGDLTDAFSRVGFGFGLTKQNGWISARIDHVLAGSGWYAERATVGKSVGSDHLPLVVDLTLAPQKP